MKEVLGIDVGATGIKGAIVNVKTGELLSERLKVPTPESKNPQDIADCINILIQETKWKGNKVGIGLPAVVINGVTHTASNIHKSWIDFDAESFLNKQTKLNCHIINDADAAGIAELHFGNVSNKSGSVLLLTLGTGIGSALFINGHLVPNTELGWLYYKDSVAEKYTSNKARKVKGLEWNEYGKELNEFLLHIDYILHPNLIILGGGISKKFEKYASYISDNLNVVPAKKLNDAGIIGAALSVK